MTQCDPPIIPDAPSGGVLACSDPALPVGDDLIGFERCTAAGPVTVIGRLTAPDNQACPPVAGGVWEQVGWVDSAGVFTAGAWPALVPCTAQSGDDYEIACASTDGRLLLIKIDSVGTVTVTNIDGTPIVDGATPVKCAGADYEIVESCWTDDVTQVTRLVILAVPAGTVAATVWIDGAGTIIPAPIGYHLCDQTRRMVASEQWCVTVPDMPEQCVRTDSTFDISTLGSLLVSGAPGGPYVLEIETATSADATNLIAMQAVLAQPNTRAEELVGGVSVGLWFHDQQQVSATLIDPTHVQIVMDIAAPVVGLPAPCVDDPTWDYAATAALLTSVYDAAGNGSPVGGASDITFNVRHYESQAATVGSQTIVERRKWQELDGTISIEDFAVDSSTGAETPLGVLPAEAEWTAGACTLPDTLIQCGGSSTITTLTQVPQSQTYNRLLTPFVGPTAPPYELLAQPASTISGVRGNANVIDGTEWVVHTLPSQRVNLSLNDGEQVDSIDFDDASNVAFSAPIVWSAGADPSGGIFNAQLQAEVGNALTAKGIPFIAVFATQLGMTPSTGSWNVQIFGTNITTPQPAYLISPTYTTSTFQWQVQVPTTELDLQIPLAIDPACTLTDTGVTITAVMTIPTDETVIFGTVVQTGTGPVYGPAPAPYTAALGTGASETYTLVLPFAGTDAVSATPYALTAADLASLQVWVYLGSLSSDQVQVGIDGFTAAVDQSCPSTPSFLPGVAICQDQLDGLATDIATGIVIPAQTGRTYVPHLVEDSSGAFRAVSLNGVRSIAVLVLAGQVAVITPGDPSVTLEAGQTVRWEVTDGVDVLDPVTSLIAQGLTGDAHWLTSWEQS